MFFTARPLNRKYSEALSIRDLKEHGNKLNLSVFYRKNRRESFRSFLLLGTVTRAINFDTNAVS